MPSEKNPGRPDPVQKIRRDWGIDEQPKPSQIRKPVDRWLALGAIVPSIILYLFPKTRFVVALCAVAIFLLLIHPVWKFWWIEDSLYRRTGGLLFLAAICGFIAYAAWPLPARLIPVGPSAYELAKAAREGARQGAREGNALALPSSQRPEAYFPKPSTFPSPNVTVIFKDSPLFKSLARRKRIIEQVSAFHDYLTGVGFKDLPLDMPPLGIRPGKFTTQAWSDNDALTGGMDVGEDVVDDGRSVVEMYSQFSFHHLVWPPVRSTRDYALFDYAANFQISPYFVQSFLNTGPLPHREYGIQDALWEIRHKYGREYADRVVYFTFVMMKKTVDANSGPIVKDLSLSTSDTTAYFTSNLFSGDMVVDNQMHNWTFIRDLLKEHGLISDR